ncbi:MULTISPECIES: hypothetical protein [unclassified Leisingera]|uniref:hypothetical protein n=1 Tax=unclassified Leisingera TaxID=2614906 RepID=UPI00126990B4|nr:MULTISPECIES: hypothetical protein [unclassified Leisingera]
MSRLIADAYATGKLKRLMLTGMTEQETLALIGQRRARKRLKVEVNRKTQEANRASSRSAQRKKFRNVRSRCNQLQIPPKGTLATPPRAPHAEAEAHAL